MFRFRCLPSRHEVLDSVLKILNEFEIRPLLIDHDSELAKVKQVLHLYVHQNYFNLMVFIRLSKLRN